MKSIGVVCADSQRWTDWVKGRGRLNRTSREFAEGEDWKARRIISANSLRGSTFDEVILLPGFDAVNMEAILPLILLCMRQ
jgi:hypothetical protein